MKDRFQLWPWILHFLKINMRSIRRNTPFYTFVNYHFPFKVKSCQLIKIFFCNSIIVKCLRKLRGLFVSNVIVFLLFNFANFIFFLLEVCTVRTHKDESMKQLSPLLFLSAMPKTVSYDHKQTSFPSDVLGWKHRLFFKVESCGVFDDVRQRVKCHRRCHLT